MSVQKEMTKSKKPKKETRQITFEEFLKAIHDDVDPLKYAGEGWFAVDEYARPGDIFDPYVRGDIIGQDDYYPRPDLRNKMRRY